MISINIDNLTAFYLGMSILAFGATLLVIFGKTEEEPNKKARKTTTTS